MAKRLSSEKKTVPLAFGQYNETRSERTVRLTRQAIARLQADNQKVTLAALSAATRQVDEQAQGITTTTILRNPAAAALFRQHSPAYQAKHQASLAELPAEIEPEIPAAYRGLSAAELVQQLERLKKRVITLRAQHDKLKTQRDEAYRQRDEALRQNTTQLARLTYLMNQAGETDD